MPVVAYLTPRVSLSLCEQTPRVPLTPLEFDKTLLPEQRAARFLLPESGSSAAASTATDIAVVSSEIVASGLAFAPMPAQGSGNDQLVLHRNL